MHQKLDRIQKVVKVKEDNKDNLLEINNNNNTKDHIKND